MTVASALRRLRALAESFPTPEMPWEDRPVFLPPLDARRLADLAALPPELLEFFALCGRVRAGNIRNGYDVGDWGAVQRDPANGLPLTIDREPVFAVGFDGGGNAFLHSLADGRVWRWDHETGATAPVADSFAQLLHRIADDWEHHLADDREWVYLA